MIKLTAAEKRERTKASRAKWRLNNKEKIKDYNESYYTATTVRQIGRKKRSKSTPSKERIKYLQAEWYKKNKDKYKEYRRVNKDSVNANNAQYRARKFNATIYMTDKEKKKIEELYQIAQDATKLFGYVWAVDHIVPLNKGGLHKLTNLQVVPAIWNRVKGDRSSDLYWG